MQHIELRRSEKARICGFCQSGHHKTCAIGIRNRGRIVLCQCTTGGCEAGRRKCTECGNRTTDEVNPLTWKCHDQEACSDLIEARRDSNPLLADLREARSKAKMAEIEKKAEKAEKVAKEKPKTYCLVTGEETKGGLFKPGMDARYASNHVEAVMSGAQTLDQAVAKAKKDGVSEKLVAKIEKGVRLAQEKKAKSEKAKADKEAEKAAAAKAEPANA